MNQLMLTGCQPEPLAGYLKALGVLRLVSAQIDPKARGRWTPQGFELTTTLHESELLSFFLDEYRPTPVVSPWNGGSGFHPKDNQDAIAQIRTSDLARLASYRLAIKTVDSLGLAQAGEEKPSYVLRLRNQFPDEALGWIDAAVVLTGDNEARFPILLGTGGNDGRLDFSNNFMQRIVDALSLAPTKKSAADRPRKWLAHALLGRGEVALVDAAIGQFDPGSAGGSNSSPHGKGKSLVNPWDFVLMIEGAMLWAGSAVRRKGEDRSNASIPFTFGLSPTGFGTAAEENGRGEIWAPVWEERATIGAVQTLFGEGRLEWAGQTARTGIDALRAVSTLQADRRISSFVRYSIVERFGLSNVAVAVDRVVAPSEQRRDVQLTSQLDPWIRSVRRAVGDKGPAGARTLLRAYDDAVANLARQDDNGEGLVDVLRCVSALELTVGRSRSLREKVPRPFSLRTTVSDRTMAASWANQFEGLRSIVPEAAIAWALAGAHDTARLRLSRLRTALLPIDERGAWTTEPVVEGFGTRPILEVLGEVAHRRSYDRPARQADTERRGARVAFERQQAPSLEVARALAAGAIDQELLHHYLQAFVLLGDHAYPRSPSTTSRGHLPSPFAALFAHAGSAEPAIPVPPGLIRQLLANEPGAMNQLRRSITIEGFEPLFAENEPRTLGLCPAGAAAALLLNLHRDRVENMFISRAGNPTARTKRNQQTKTQPQDSGSDTNSETNPDEDASADS